MLENFKKIKKMISIKYTITCTIIANANYLLL